jgi:cytochrome c-type biogenesis protein CcmH/NrfF
MKKVLLWLIVAAVLVIGFAVYRSRSRNHLDVTPEAHKEIEKAKQR